MAIRRIRGPTVRAALRAVEVELGPGALIVETRALADGSGAFEIAAVPGPTRRPAPATGWSPAFRDLAARGRAFGLPESLLRKVDAALRSEGLARAEPGARAVYRAAVQALADLLPAARLGSDVRATAFVGPAGVGKTTTIAKLAARATHNRRPIALASIDVARPGATTPLEHLADALGAPFARLRDGTALRSLLDADPDGPHLLVDTPGVGPRDRPALDRVRVAIVDPRIRTVLCIAAAARRTDADATADGFAPLAPAAAVVTRWDETTQAGEVLGALAARAIPLAFVSTGPRVPDDLIDADPAAIAACALGLGEDVAAEILA